MWRIKRICVFKHSVMTNFNCACPAIQRGQGSGFLWKVPLDSLLVWASSGGSGETARKRRLAWIFAARIGDKYQIRLTRPKCFYWRSKCVLLKYSYKDCQHIKRFVAYKLMQTDMFIYCFDAFLNIQESHVMDTIKGYFTQRNVTCEY